MVKLIIEISDDGYEVHGEYGETHTNMEHIEGVVIRNAVEDVVDLVNGMDRDTLVREYRKIVETKRKEKQNGKTRD